MQLLRDALLSALADLPGTREFHLHVLVSAPRKHNDLYPYSVPRQRCYLQDIIVLLSEQATPDSPRLLVAAIEAYVYNIPSTSSAILYISKVDSTGQGAFPSPVSALVKGLVCYYGDPSTRPIVVDHLWVQLFARAQGQYLFPNSTEHPAKKPLSDTKLCAWWMRVLSSAATDLQGKNNTNCRYKLFYLLPGYNELEANQSLKVKSPPDASIRWAYGHPYSQTDIPLPGPVSAPFKNLGEYIPSYEDDPKSRFLDEMACANIAEAPRSPERKRPRRASQAEGSSSTPDNTHAKQSKTGHTVHPESCPVGELSRVTPDEFWERMSFRQECVAGAVTGFFTLVVSSTPDKDAAAVPAVASSSNASPLAPQQGQVSTQMNKRIMTSLLTAVEFSNAERSIRGTEAIESLIRGLCEGLTLPIAPRARPPPSRDQRTPEPESRSATLLAPPKTPPPRERTKAQLAESISPNPFDEPETSLETYNSHIYGSIFVKNAEAVKAPLSAAERQPPITVLAVRRKKKRTEG